MNHSSRSSYSLLDDDDDNEKLAVQTETESLLQNSSTGSNHQTIQVPTTATTINLQHSSFKDTKEQMVKIDL
ncbi:hypothetical protein DERF_006760 [Dermatophagoides farinae]|uniref:Uncharacterized protein n=1 Tax=Dermatophagoides farinae TaxID=6954 RepID=A0A922L3V3_DERFA|nr:hypothetical protein DERF_006760 [Dermatophagoides farinae]